MSKMDFIKNIVLAFLQGLFDSVRGIFVIFYLDREMNKRNAVKAESPEEADTTKKLKTVNKENKRQEQSKVGIRVFQCCALNGGVFLLSLLFFDYLMLPMLKTIIMYFLGESTVWNFIQFILSRTFEVVWVLPLFLLSKIINALWFQDIADSAYKYRKGRPTLIPNISKLIADVLFSLLVQFLFLIQSTVVNFLPINYLGSILSFIHICLLYSLYSFEYKWFNMGWELHRRLSYIEINCPYFLGFGFLLAALTQICASTMISGCIFSMLFPLFILSANESTPKQSSSEFPLRIFSLVVTISNSLFSRSVKIPSPASRSIAQTAAKPINNQNQIRSGVAR